MRNRTALGALAGVAVMALAVTPAAADSHEGAALSVLHGVPDLTVDVWVDGEPTIEAFEPGDLAGPLELPAGTYEVAITESGAEEDSDPAIGPVDLTLEAGGNYTAAAHLDADGSPTANLFTNDVSEAAAGEGRLTVRHAAAAPAVDILAGDEAVVTELANAEEATLDLPADTISASVAAAGTTDAVLGPADVPVQEGALTIVYAWGSLDDDTLDLAVQTIEGLHSAPDGVPTGQIPVGEGGISPVVWLVLAAGLGVVVLGLVRRSANSTR